MRVSINREYQPFCGGGVVIVSGTEFTAPFISMVCDEVRKASSRRLWDCQTFADYRRMARSKGMGRWWYSGSVDGMSEAELKRLADYMESPSPYGTAMFVGMDYRKLRDLVPLLTASKDSHEISTAFPGKVFLRNYAISIAESMGYVISQGVADYFVGRAGNRYEDYAALIQMIEPTHFGGMRERDELTRKAAQVALKDVDGSTLDDLMERLVSPLPQTARSLSRTNKLFRSYRSLIDNDNPKKLLNRLRYRLTQCFVIRKMIDDGLIPIGIEFTVESVKKRMPKRTEKTDSKVFTPYTVLQWSDYKLQKEAALANKASLADWLNMRLLADKQCRTDEEAEGVLFEILLRKGLSVE